MALHGIKESNEKKNKEKEEKKAMNERKRCVNCGKRKEHATANECT